MTAPGGDGAELRRELAQVKARLAEAEETLEAIRAGEVDALVVRGRAGHEVYTLDGADRPYRRLVEAMTEGAALLLQDGTILYCNGRLAEMLNQPLSSAIGGALQRFVPARHREAVGALLRGAAKAKGQFELELSTADQRQVPVLLSASSMEDAEVPAISLVATDLTEHRKRAEIVSAAERLKAANEVLREADRRKDDFLAMLAHELRNPLAPITTAIHQLVTRTRDREDLARPLGVLSRQTFHMTKLVDELLEVSRITCGKVRLQKERLDAATIVGRAVETSRPLIDAKHHELTIGLPGEPLWLEADPGRLVQALANLLNNATKYTDENGHIWITAERDGAQAVFRVRDDGTGLTKELMPRLFDLFTQADTSLDRAQGGLGIGLTLVRGLVELHGGTVEAHSEGPGQGSEFVVRLPALPVATPSPDPLRSSDPAIAGSARRVVVVDDNLDAAATLGDLLADSGHAVELAHDGPTALEVVRRHAPRIVFIDIGLPGMDGYEVARRLRREHGRALRLVALTGYGQDGHRKHAQEAGFDEYLVKPTPARVLFDVVERACD